MNTIGYNAHHSPVGAFATFTLGYPGRKGGLGLELGGPADENVYIGVESPRGGAYHALPFFDHAENEAIRYTGRQARSDKARPGRIQPLALDGLEREFKPFTDTWRAPDLEFTIISPAYPVPNPVTGSARALKRALIPAVFGRLRVDNRRRKRPKRVFIGYGGSDPYAGMRHLSPSLPRDYAGIASGNRTAMIGASADWRSGIGFTAEEILKETNPENLRAGLGNTGLLLGEVGAGEEKTFRVVFCFYRDGIATTGIDATYWYCRHYNRIEAAGLYGFDQFEKYAGQAETENARYADPKLSDDQRFMLAHATHSYFGSTQLLEVDGRPLWVVNEGEYRMLNTLDLTADQFFFEMRRNPWTVRNVLDWYSERYFYFDQVRFPGSTALYPGGLCFTHDMGVANQFSRPGHSCYEKAGLTACFSHMTCEELVNWLACAVGYVLVNDDIAWAELRSGVLLDGLASLLNRDHPDPDARDGIMSLDSNRCEGGAEITTYDSLDTSLGQARDNLYLAVKAWAVTRGLEKVFDILGQAEAAEAARSQAGRTCRSLLELVREDGTFPAVRGERSHRYIIPVIEGLVFLREYGLLEGKPDDRDEQRLVAALGDHLETVLKPGRCRFDGGGWKLSSTSINSWLSKIYLCQFIGREILRVDAAADPDADAAHAAWLLDPDNAYYAWSDQFHAGRLKGSRYYPRGVTSVLWLEEGNGS